MRLPWLTLWSRDMTVQTRLAQHGGRVFDVRPNNQHEIRAQIECCDISAALRGRVIIEEHPTIEIDDEPISGTFIGMYERHNIIQRRTDGPVGLQVFYRRIEDSIDWAFHEQMETA